MEILIYTTLIRENFDENSKFRKCREQNHYPRHQVATAWAFPVELGKFSANRKGPRSCDCRVTVSYMYEPILDRIYDNLTNVKTLHGVVKHVVIEDELHQGLSGGVQGTLLCGSRWRGFGLHIDIKHNTIDVIIKLSSIQS